MGLYDNLDDKLFYTRGILHYYNRTITRFSIKTAGLAFGGTGLCSYRVRGVGASRAEHLTVESCTIIISL